MVEELKQFDGFKVWDGSYSSHIDYEIILYSDEIIKCYGKGGFMYSFDTGKSYSKDLVRGIRECKTQSCYIW